MPLFVRSFPFSDKRSLDAFLRLPWKIYSPGGRRDPNWVPPLLSDVRGLLDPGTNPFWEHAEGALFLAVDERGEAVGRVAAIVDQNHNEVHGERTGFFGFFECVNDAGAAAALFSAVEGWVRERGMERLRGPVSPSMNEECGFLLEGYGAPPRLSMPYNPPYYLDLAASCGFSKVKDLYAWWMPAGVPLPDRVRRITERVKRREGLVLRNLDMRRFDAEVEALKEVYNRAWEKNWGFVPLTDAEFRWMAKKLRPLAWPDMIHIAEVAGRPVACNIIMPDYNQVLRRLDGRLTPWALLKFLWYSRRIDEVRMMAMGVVPEYRGKGVDAVMYAAALEAGTRRGIQGGELSWTLEDNERIHEGIRAMGGRLEKKYRLVEKAAPS